MGINDALATDQRHGVAKRFTAVVSSWPGVEAAPHRFGGVEFRLGRCELGHLHGVRSADLPFLRRVRNALIAAGRPHHLLRDSGWVTVPLDAPDGADRVIELFRLSYERAARAASKLTRTPSVV